MWFKVENEKYFILPKEYNIIRPQMKESGLDKITYDEFILGNQKRTGSSIHTQEWKLNQFLKMKTQKCNVFSRTNYYARDYQYKYNRNKTSNQSKDSDDNQRRR